MSAQNTAKRSAPAKMTAPAEAAAVKAKPTPTAKAKAAAATVTLTGHFETETGGYRKFAPGVHALPPHLVAEAKARGLVADDA
jgi:phosphate-selective porin